MNNITFRGKRTYENEWVYGFFYKKSNRFVIRSGECLFPEFDVIPETVGQYTGFVDKNERAIYEGDIVRVNILGMIINCVVQFLDGHFELNGKNRKTLKKYSFYINMNCDMEVIGNIYENVNLLEEV